ncbi:MAG: hypothetical protein QM765_49005 [Myxococcales bacterium]
MISRSPLDRFSGRGYKAALVFGAWLLMAAPVAAADGVVVKGAVLPGGSQQVGEDRYKSPSNWKDTLTWIEKKYPKSTYPYKTIVNQPGIRGFHIVNVDKKGEWEGINVYELDGETRFFVVSRDPPKEAPKDGGIKAK